MVKCSQEEEAEMELKSQSDHIALLALMVVGVLTERLADLGHLDDNTADHIRRMVQGVRIHARNAGLADINVLLDNLERGLPAHAPAESPSDRSWLPHH
jgi:hypothetical protein